MNRQRRVRITGAMLLLWGLGAAGAAAQTECPKHRVATVGGITVWTLPPQPAFFYKAGMAIDADGAPNAYHPDNIGLDYLANAGHEGNWWGVVTDTGKPDGTPVVQGAEDPLPGYYISTTALQDKTKKRTDPRRYVDSGKIPFIVLPKKLADTCGAKLGDLAMVARPEVGKTAAAIYADIGPANKLGEGSMALAKALDVQSNPKKGGIGKGIFYIVFPGSGNGKPRSVEDIDREATRLFDQWGGMDKLNACLQ